MGTLPSSLRYNHTLLICTTVTQAKLRAESGCQSGKKCIKMVNPNPVQLHSSSKCSQRSQPVLILMGECNCNILYSNTVVVTLVGLPSDCCWFPCWLSVNFYVGCVTVDVIVRVEGQTKISVV